MNTISDILFVVSNGLMIPVMLLLIFFLIKGLIMAVNLIPELSRHRKQRTAASKMIANIDRSMDKEQLECDIDTLEVGIFKKAVDAVASHSYDTAYCERAIANYEVEVRTILAKSSSLVKLGPMLGLMGTLIPMGPALVGLASGDLNTMAYNMQVAFATTVVGMLVAAIGVATLQIYQRYYAYAVNDLEYIYSKLTENNEAQEKQNIR